jgi:hypothetical protein
MGKDKDRQRARILRFLAHGAATVSQAGNGKGLLLDGGDRGTVSVDRGALAAMLQAGVVQLGGDRLTLAKEAGRRDDRTGISAFQDQQRDLDTATMETGSGPETVCVNVAESPLGLLLRRKGKDGAPFLSRSEFEAGERLRADFTRGQLMPRLGANWVASVASGRRDGGVAELTDAALAARLRVERAVVAVGPELSGILIDVCCFLKGMETVEIERGWPVRSAKVVLKAALGALSRHYQPAPPAGRNGRQRVLHWGASDYRPSLD